MKVEARVLLTIPLLLLITAGIVSQVPFKPKTSWDKH